VDGRKPNSFEEIAALGNEFFKNLYKDLEEVTIFEVIQVAQFFMRFTEEEDNQNLMVSISKGELEAVLKIMQRDKSLGPNAWTMELYQGFFKLIGDDLLQLVEDSHLRGKIHKPFNLIFLAMIPKVDDPQNFEEYRPISLCNCIYKIISKS